MARTCRSGSLANLARGTRLLATCGVDSSTEWTCFPSFERDSSVATKFTRCIVDLARFSALKAVFSGSLNFVFFLVAFRGETFSETRET